MRISIKTVCLFFFIITFPLYLGAEKNVNNLIASFNDEIEDGWYVANVRYQNFNTYTRSSYSLNVKVVDDRVTVIDFGNGGSVHSGYNSSGYFYNGGYLSFETDYEGNIVAATTRVTINSSDGNTLYYDIRIE